MKFIRVLIASPIIWAGAVTSIVLYPLFFLFWSLFNRKKIALWLSLPVMLLSSIPYLQLYEFYNQIPNAQQNPAFLYGLFLFPFFLSTRIYSLRKTPFKKKPNKFLLAIFFSLSFIFPQVLIVVTHIFASMVHQTTNFYISEIALVFWGSLLTYLFFHYSEDPFMEYICTATVRFYSWVNSNTESNN